MTRFALAAALLLPCAVHAQPDTAFARETYAEVEQRLARLARTDFSMRRPGADFTSEVRAWSEGGEVRKVQAVDHDDDGDVVTDYYFARGQLVFAYQAVKGRRDDQKLVTRVEQRQYFRDGRMVHWLGGLEKAPIPPSDPDFAPGARARLQEAAQFVRGARLVAGKRTTGTLERLVGGDAACYLEMRDEAGRAFTEPGDFGICARDPSPAGRRVQLAWGVADVQSPSCQGNPRCTKTERVALVTGLRFITYP